MVVRIGIRTSCSASVDWKKNRRREETNAHTEVCVESNNSNMLEIRKLQKISNRRQVIALSKVQTVQLEETCLFYSIVYILTHARLRFKAMNRVYDT